MWYAIEFQHISKFNRCHSSLNMTFRAEQEARAYINAYVQREGGWDKFVWIRIVNKQDNSLTYIKK